MKRNIGFILFFTYLLSLSGLMVQLHFCGDELANFRIGKAIIEEDHSCCTDEPIIVLEEHNDTHTCSVDDDCCEDHFVNIDSGSDYLNQSFPCLDILALQSVNVPSFNYFQLPNYYAIEALANVKNNGPPIDIPPSVPPYIKFQKLILYG